MTRQQTISAQAWISMATLALIWGGSFLSFSVALRDLPVLTIVAFRVGIAALVLWGVIWWQGIAVPRSRWIWAAMLVMGLLNNVIPFSLIIWGQTQIESGLASILNAATAIFGILVASAIFPDERLTTRKLTGVLIGFAGVAVVIGLDSLMRFDLRSLAQLAVLAASLSYAFAGAWAKRALSGLPPIVSAAGMLTGSSLVIIPLALTLDGIPTAMPGTDVIAAVAYVSVVATACAYLLYYRVLALAGSGNLMVVTLLVVPIAVLLGVLVLGEKLPHSAYSGFAILALGMLVLDGRILRLFSRTAGDTPG